MSEHGEKSQEQLESMMQQLKKGTLNSFDLESAKSNYFSFSFKKTCIFKANNQKIKNCTEDALFYYKKHLVLLHFCLNPSEINIFDRKLQTPNGKVSIPNSIPFSITMMLMKNLAQSSLKSQFLRQ